MKHILLTGEINVGKSTIINRILADLELELEVAGFKTLPYLVNERVQGYHIVSMLNQDQSQSLSLIANKVDNGCQPLVKTFENRGVNILKRSLTSDKKVVLMDELGYLEAQAEKFKHYIWECFEANKLVLGVIKSLDLDYLNEIRSRSDVELVKITKENREEKYITCKRILQQQLTN
ncbi:MAG: nucleoside-triphosphatase [Bacillota bacterium]